MDFKATSNLSWSLQVWSPAGNPGTGDRVYANGFTVAVNVDISLISIHTEANAGLGAVAGGGFTCTTNRNITCNSIAGTTACLLISGTSAVNFVGDSFGGGGTSAYGLQKTSSGNFTMVGNGYGGSGTAAAGVVISGSGGTHSITGNGYGGSGNSAAGIDCGTTLNVTINGNGYGGISFPGIRSTGTGQVIINGLGIASASSSGVQGSSSLTSIFIQGAECHSNGTIPLNGWVRFLNTNPSMVVYKQSGASATLTDAAEIANNVPADSDVRLGVSYMAGSRTGTLIVPPKASVALNVPTDDGVGTYSIDPNALADALLIALLASNNPQAIRWKQNLTPAELANQLVATFNSSTL